MQSTQTDCDSGKRQVHRELCISAVRGPSGDHDSRRRRKYRCPAFANCSVQLMITVKPDSYASDYCEEQQLQYTYPDANDWLLGGF